MPGIIIKKALKPGCLSQLLWRRGEREKIPYSRVSFSVPEICLRVSQLSSGRTLLLRISDLQGWLKCVNISCEIFHIHGDVAREETPTCTFAPWLGAVWRLTQKIQHKNPVLYRTWHMINSLLKALNFSATVCMGANSWFTQLTKFFACIWLNYKLAIQLYFHYTVTGFLQFSMSCEHRQRTKWQGVPLMQFT